MMANFERLGIGELAHHHRHIMELGDLRRAPASLARDDLERLGIALDGRTRIGAMTPFSRTEAARSPSASSANFPR